MNARTPQFLAAITITLACLLLAGTYALVRADAPQAAEVAAEAVGCKKTATPTDRPTATDTPEPTMTSTLWTPQPPTLTPKPPKPTATPTPEKDKPTGDVCLVPDDSVGELFTMDDWRMYYSDPERLEKHVIRETTNPSCVKLKAGTYVVLWWNENTGHGGPAVAVTVKDGNTQYVREP